MLDHLKRWTPARASTSPSDKSDSASESTCFSSSSSSISSSSSNSGSRVSQRFSFKTLDSYVTHSGKKVREGTRKAIREKIATLVATTHLPYRFDSLSIEQTPLCRDIENSCKFLNVVCCLIACRSSKVAIASVYRSPSICPNDYLVEINDVFSQLLQVSSSVIVVGDFNFDLL